MPTKKQSKKQGPMRAAREPSPIDANIPVGAHVSAAEQEKAALAGALQDAEVTEAKLAAKRARHFNQRAYLEVRDQLQGVREAIAATRNSGGDAETVALEALGDATPALKAAAVEMARSFEADGNLNRVDLMVRDSAVSIGANQPEQRDDSKPEQSVAEILEGCRAHDREAEAQATTTSGAHRNLKRQPPLPRDRRRHGHRREPRLRPASQRARLLRSAATIGRDHCEGNAEAERATMSVDRKAAKSYGPDVPTCDLRVVLAERILRHAANNHGPRDAERTRQLAKLDDGKPVVVSFDQLKPALWEAALVDADELHAMTGEADWYLVDEDGGWQPFERGRRDHATKDEGAMMDMPVNTKEQVRIAAGTTEGTDAREALAEFALVAESTHRRRMLTSAALRGRSRTK